MILLDPRDCELTRILTNKNMKKKEVIAVLTRFNEWRRWGEGKQPDPKNVWKAIDRAIHYMSCNGRVENAYQKQYEDTQALLDAGVWELRFANMSIEFLYNALDEIASMTNDPLSKKVAEMAKERHQLDKIIHARTIFE